MMDELLLRYYFEDTNEVITPDIFLKSSYPWEVLNKIEGLLETYNFNGVHSKAEIGEFVSITGYHKIGKGTVVHPNVTIEGPVIIGENCIIMPGALIRPGSIISDNCIIGHCCEIKNSILFNGAKVQSFTFVGDSIIGRSARIGSGTICANRKFNQSTVGIKTNGVFHSFETDFFGCILGDYSRIGANCTTTPGTLIGPHTWIFPSTKVGGFIPKDKRVQTENPLIISDNERIDLKP